MTVSTTVIDELVAALPGLVSVPGDPDWDSARAAWNLAVDQQPAAVVFPAEPADVSAVIRLAAAAGLRVTAQATGHLAAAVGDLADTVLIRTTRLDEVVLDAASRTMRVGAGVVWGSVNAALEGTGLTALAGSSPDVGVAGYTLGGGFSWLARSRGLAASSVTAIEVVLADGTLVRATLDDHADVFWALRGGGGAFGIVTAIELRVYPIAEVYAGMLLYPIERSREVLEEFARWTADLDERVTSCARILRLPPLPDLPDFLSGKSFVGIDGAIDAPDAVAEQLLSGLRAMAPVIDTFARVPATRLAEIHMDPPAPVPAFGGGLATTALGPDVIDALLASAAGSESSPLLLVDIRHAGGAVGRPQANGGAVDHLDGRYFVFTAGLVMGPEALTSLVGAVDSVLGALEPWATERTYSNFLEGPEVPERIWDSATLERLRAIKRAVDPGNVVRAAHELEAVSG